MKRLAVLLLAVSLLAMSACASTKPCPAYAKAMQGQESRG